MSNSLLLYSQFFAFLGILVTALMIFALRGRISIKRSLSTIIVMLATYITYAIIMPIPRPFIDYLIIEWFFIPQIMIITTLRADGIKLMTIYGIIIAVIPIFPLGEISYIVGSGATVFVPIGVAMYLVFVKDFKKKIVYAAAYLVLNIVSSLLNSTIRGSPFLIDIFIGIVVFWIIFGKGIGLYFWYTANKKPQDYQFSVANRFRYELQRKAVHMSIPFFFITIPLGRIIVESIRAAEAAAFGEDSEIVRGLDWMLSLNDLELGLLLMRYAFMMIFIAFVVADFLRLKYIGKRYTPAQGYYTKITRRKEMDKFLGSTDILISGALAVLFIGFTEAVILIAILVAADTATALIGIRFGKHRFIDKSIEGTLAGIIVGITFGVALTGNVLLSIVGTAIFMVADILSDYIPASDNLIAPLGMAVAFHFLTL